MRRNLAFALVPAAALMLTACTADPSVTEGSGSDGEGEESGGTLTIGQEYDFGTMDPAIITSVGDTQMVANVFEGLTRYEYGTTELSPGLATEWEMSEDGTEWTFQLREGVQFHEGYGELTADDVVFTFERAVSEELASPNAELLSAMEAVTAVDDHTVQFNLSAPDPSWLHKLADQYTGIVSAAAVQERGDNFGLDPVGTGMYEFDQWIQGQQTNLVAFDDYWGGEPLLEGVVYRAIPDAVTRHNAFLAGEIDINQVTDPELYTQLEGTDGVQFTEAEGLITRFLGWRSDQPPFDDPRVREAVTLAIDRDAMMEGIFAGISTPADGILSSGVEHALEGILGYEHDPERARELMAEAGYADGVDVTLTVGNVDRFTRPATVIQQDLAEVGIRMEIEVIESQTMLADLTSEEGLQMFLLSRGQDPTPDRVLDSWFSTDNIPANNWARVSDPEVDAWLDEATTTIDEDVRAEAFANVQRRIAEEHYYYFIDHEEMIFAYHDRVEGFVTDPQRSLRLDEVRVSS